MFARTLSPFQALYYNFCVAIQSWEITESSFSFSMLPLFLKSITIFRIKFSQTPGSPSLASLFFQILGQQILIALGSFSYAFKMMFKKIIIIYIFQLFSAKSLFVIAQLFSLCYRWNSLTYTF